MTSSTPNPLSFHNYYLVGIKGVGMAALAACLIDQGKHVSGWDVAEDFVTQKQLTTLPINIETDNKLPDDIDAVIFTAAHQDSHHPIVQQAHERGLACFSLAEITGELSRHKHTIAVCGVGGKSTTAAMLAWMFSFHHALPSYLVGVGSIGGLDQSGAWHQSSQTFIVEADEYVSNPSQVAAGQPPQPRFLLLQPQTIICTQVVHDHPDVYPSVNETKAVFSQFFNTLPDHGLLISNADDVLSQELIQHRRQSNPTIRILTVGQEVTADIRLTNIKSKQGETTTQVIAPTLSPSTFQLKLHIPGQHNLWNAAAALAAATQPQQPEHLSVEQCLSALAEFTSTSRRMEYRGTHNKTVFYDDYAHHPLEITASIQAIREWYPDLPIVVIFQPHTYSRTKALLEQFATSLQAADEVVLVPIFASAREPVSTTVSSEHIAQAIKPNRPVTVYTSITECVPHVQALPQSVVITMGAGDVYRLYDHLNLKM